VTKLFAFPVRRLLPEVCILVQEAVTSAYFGEKTDVGSYAFSSFSQNSTQQPATHHSNPRHITLNHIYRTRGACK